MKLKDINPNIDISNYLIDFKPISKHITIENYKTKGYIVSIWNKGMWIKQDKTSLQMFPLCLDCEFDEIKEEIFNLDIIENE